MNSSIKIQDTNLDITQFKCSQCQQSFTQQDKETNNWDVWWNTSRKVVIEEIINWNLSRISLEISDLTHKFYAEQKYFNCLGIAKEVSHA